MKYTDFYKEIKADIKDEPKNVNADPVELAMGEKDELEHTKDPKVARIIALQHLKTDPKYYSRLKAAGIDEAPMPSIKEDFGGGEESSGASYKPTNKTKGKNTLGKIGATPQTDLTQQSSGDKDTPRNPVIDKSKKDVAASSSPQTGTGIADNDNDNTAAIMPQMDPSSELKAVVIDINENIKNKLKGYIKKVIKEEGYGSYKVGGRTYRTFQDSPQFPKDAVLNPEVNEEKEEEEKPIKCGECGYVECICGVDKEKK